jgi:hypothetical protein
LETKSNSYNIKNEDERKRCDFEMKNTLHVFHLLFFLLQKNTILWNTVWLKNHFSSVSQWKTTRNRNKENNKKVWYNTYRKVKRIIGSLVLNNTPVPAEDVHSYLLLLFNTQREFDKNWIELYKIALKLNTLLAS